MRMGSSKVRVGRRGVEGNGWMNGCVDIGMGTVLELRDRFLLSGRSDDERGAGGDGTVLVVFMGCGDGLYKTLFHAQARMGVYSTLARKLLNLRFEL